MPHVTVAGDRAGDYVIREERPDGTLVLQPETTARASLRELGLHPMSDAEFAELAVDMQPPDNEG